MVLDKYKAKFNQMQQDYIQNKTTGTGKGGEMPKEEMEEIREEDNRSPDDIYRFNGDIGKDGLIQKSEIMEDSEIMADFFREGPADGDFPEVQVNGELDCKKALFPDPPRPPIAHQNPTYGSSLKRGDEMSSLYRGWTPYGWPDTNFIHRLHGFGLSSSLYNLADQNKGRNSNNGCYPVQQQAGIGNGCSSQFPPYQNLLLPRDLPNPRTHADNNLNNSNYNESGRHISDSNAEKARLSKDEKIAREAGITFRVQEIINLPMDEFNDLLSKHDLSEDQLNMCRDIRRRGKNKVAAQNCRKRKIDQIDELQERLEEAHNVKRRLMLEHERLKATKGGEAEKLNSLMNQIIISHNLNPQHYTIKVLDNEEVQIVRKTNNNEENSRSNILEESNKNQEKNEMIDVAAFGKNWESSTSQNLNLAKLERHEM